MISDRNVCETVIFESHERIILREYSCERER